jgi:hypothetical protein
MICEKQVEERRNKAEIRKIGQSNRQNSNADRKKGK